LSDLDLIIVVDDDEAVRDSLEVLLAAEGFLVQSFGSAAQLLAEPQLPARGCLLLDVRMPDMDGLELQRRLVARGVVLPIIVMTGHGDVPIAVRAMKAGAADFIEKPFTAEAIGAAIRQAIAGGQQRLAQSEAAEAIRLKLEALTPREREVLERLVLGRPNKVIAYELSISPRTVEIHRARVMEKMQADSLSHLVRLALVAGVQPDSGAGK
jgi:two-component system response regulator FixJ